MMEEYILDLRNRSRKGARALLSKARDTIDRNKDTHCANRTFKRTQTETTHFFGEIEEY